MISARILGSAHLLPGRAVSTAEVVERTFPGKDPARLIAATGIYNRQWVEPGTRATDLGVEVLRQALDAAGLPASALERVIFVSSIGGDWLIPSTATAIIGALGINGKADGFDLMNACVGMLSGIDLAARSVATGMGPVAVVTVELISRIIHTGAPRVYGLFGDRVAAVILGPARPGEGFEAVHFGNDFAEGPTISMPHPTLIGGYERADFATSTERMTQLAVGGVVQSVTRVLEKAGLTMDEVDWFLPHQPNRPLLGAILAALNLDPSRVDIHVDQVGSVGAASVGISLDRLMRSGKVKPGDRILTASVGSPVVYGAMLYRVGESDQGAL